MKVLHCIYSLSGGGAETQCKLLATSLSQKNIDVHVVCVDRGVVELSPDVKVHLIDRKSKYDLSAYLEISKVVATVAPDVIHAWLPAAMTIPSMLAGLRYRVPVVFSFRNRMFFHRPVSYFEYLIALFGAKKIISNNAIGQSSPAFRWLYRRKEGEIIHNGVKIPSVKRSMDVKKKRSYRILYAGRLTAQKNVGLLIQALKKLADLRCWTLDIYGSGEMDSELHAMVDSYALNDRILFRGYCDDITQEMLSSDLLVFPSIYEGMPNVLVEAMAIGLPVLASDIDASRELIKDTSCVEWFSPNNVDELVAALDLFFRSPDSFSIKVKNGISLSREFKVEIMSSRYEGVYRSLL